MLTRLLFLCSSLCLFFCCCCNAAPAPIVPIDQITAIFPAEVFHLRVRTTEEQITLIQKTVNDHPNDEHRQWAIIRAKEPRLAETALALRNFLRSKEELLSPSGRLLFNKLIDGVPIIKFGDPIEIKNYVYETLRLWYALDLKSKQNFAKILPRNAAALSNPALVHYALSEIKRSQ